MTLINIKQGDSTTISEVITGLVSLAGYTAKMYVYTKLGVAVDTLSGTIGSLTVTYNVLNEASKAYPVGMHFFETKIFDAADHVYTPSEGVFNVERTFKNDPA